MKKTLSICMIVKNEEKNLERCLESLRELMINVPSELIIVDTGSDDNTVVIAKRYTEKIYHHLWNNNFSDMRNISISYASGKWIFVIDADEELIEPQKLILFLKQSYPKSIVGGALIVKNLTVDNADKDTVLLNSARIFRNNGGFHYEGAVHNMPVFRGRIIDIEATLNHYGYDSTDQKLMEQKFNRTSILLKYELAKNPDNIYYRFQLSRTYSMHKDYEQALQEIEQAYQTMTKNGADNSKKYLYIYGQLVKSYVQLGKNLKVEEYCSEGVTIEKEYIDLYFYMAEAQNAQEKYEQALENYCQYINLVENFDKLEIKRNPVINHYTLSQIDRALYNAIVLAFKIGLFDKVIRYTEKLMKVPNVDVDLITRAIPVFVDACMTEKNYNQLKSILLNQLQAKGLAFVEMALHCIENSRLNIDKQEERNFLSVFSSFGEQYGALNKIRLMHYNGITEELAKILTKFCRKYDINVLPDYYGDLLFYLIEIERPEEFLGNLTEFDAVRFLKYLPNEASATLNKAILAYCGEASEVEFKKLRSKKTLLKYVLSSGDFSDHNYLSIFKKYLTSGTRYIQSIYTTFVLEQESIHDLKSVEEVFMLYMLRAESGKHTESRYIQYLNKALKIFPEMNRGIKLLIQEIEEPANIASKEMADLRCQLLKHITALLDAGEGALAKKVIVEYEQICGPDLESLMLKSQAMLL